MPAGTVEVDAVDRPRVAERLRDALDDECGRAVSTDAATSTSGTISAGGGSTAVVSATVEFVLRRHRLDDLGSAATSLSGSAIGSGSGSVAATLRLGLGSGSAATTVAGSGSGSAGSGSAPARRRGSTTSGSRRRPPRRDLFARPTAPAWRRSSARVRHRVDGRERRLRRNHQVRRQRRRRAGIGDCARRRFGRPLRARRHCCANPARRQVRRGLRLRRQGSQRRAALARHLDRHPARFGCASCGMGSEAVTDTTYQARRRAAAMRDAVGHESRYVTNRQREARIMRLPRCLRYHEPGTRECRVGEPTVKTHIPGADFDPSDRDSRSRNGLAARPQPAQAADRAQRRTQHHAAAARQHPCRFRQRCAHHDGRRLQGRDDRRGVPARSTTSTTTGTTRPTRPRACCAPSPRAARAACCG